MHNTNSTIRKKCLSIILILAVVISLLPVMTLTANAAPVTVTFDDLGYEESQRLDTAYGFTFESLKSDGTSQPNGAQFLLAYGFENSPCIMPYTETGYSSTATLIIKRQDGGAFNFISIFLDADGLGCGTCDMIGYREGSPVGGYTRSVDLNIAAPHSGLNWINIDEIRFVATGGNAEDGLQMSVDNIVYELVASPTVTGISPDSGPVAGGTSVIITGTNFTGATAVSFGATPAPSYTVDSATQITATSPAGSAGTVDITVTTVAGTSATSAADQFTYFVPNSPPVISNLNGDSVAFTEGGGAVNLNSESDATVTDSDNTNFNGGNLSVSITANRVSSEDVLSIANSGTSPGQIGVNGSNVSYGGTIIGTFTGGTGTNDLVVTFNANAMPNAATALIRALTYSNTSANPSTATRTVSVTVSDGSGGTSATSNVSVGVIGINDAPTLTATGLNPTFTEGGSAAVLFSGASVSTVESGQRLLQLVLTVSNLFDGASEILNIDGTNVVLTNGTSGTTASSSMDYSVSVAGSTVTVTLSEAAGISAVDIQTIVNAITYNNTSGMPTTGSRVITLTSIKDNGGTANGGVDTTSLSTASAVTVEVLAPTITNVTSATMNGTYGIGETIDITVMFSHVVTVTGTPQLELETGAVDQTANYTGGSGSNTLTFTYTAQMGDESPDLDYKATSSLSLNGGTIKRGETNALLTLPTPGAAGSLGANKAIKVHTIVPGAPTNVTATAGDTAATVTFTAPASNGGAAITSYTVTASPGGINATGNASPIIVTGLTNGQAYIFTATATNGAGTGSASTDSNSVTPKASQTITFSNPGAQNFGTSPTLTGASTSTLPVTFTSNTPAVCTITSGGALTFLSAGTATITANQPGNDSYLPATSVSQSFTVNPVVPDPPTNVTATAGDTSATVSFTAPGFTGGTTITGYTVTVSPADVAPMGGAGSPIIMTGLTNGQAYTFTVTATNAAGTGSASTASNSVTPRASQTITFSNPGAQNFGTTPTLSATADSGLSVTFTSSTTDVCTVTMGGALTFLRAGTATITANQAGDGSYLPATPISRTFTVNPIIPGAPTSITATPGNGQATVSFTPPASNGGAAITSYTVTSSPGGITATGNTTSITVTGLTNGTAYTFTVTATNSAGLGAASSATSNVTPQVPTTGSGSSAPTQTYQADMKAGDIVGYTLPVTVDKNTGSASVDASSQSNLISEGKSAVITVPAIPNVSTYSVGIPVLGLSATNTQGSLTVDTGKGSITIPSNMLTGSDGTKGNKAQITLGEGEKDNLPEVVKAAIGDRPLIQLTLSIDGKQTRWNNPNAPVTVSIPYTPTGDELANPGSIVVWYIEGNGNVVTISNGRYDSATGRVTFDTTHFSDYAVAFNNVTFSDVSDTAWYSDAVSFIAAREITTGTGGGKYSPNAKLARGEFIVLMMRAYGITPDMNPTDNFADAGNTYYTGYLAAGKRLGITSGVGNDMYAPDKKITRQEMFTLLYNALKVIGQLPQGDSGKILSDFTDAGQVNPWAVGAMTLVVENGTISGSGGKLTPTGTTSRAEMAQVLYNLLGK